VTTQCAMVLAALISTTAPTVVATLGYLKGLKNERNIAEVKQAVVEVHLSINSRLTELVEATRSSARAEGLAEGLAVAQAPPPPPPPPTPPPPFALQEGSL
jgi:hypothetical protein